jgi:hypothetical protein
MDNYYEEYQDSFFLVYVRPRLQPGTVLGYLNHRATDSGLAIKNPPKKPTHKKYTKKPPRKPPGSGFFVLFLI